MREKPQSYHNYACSQLFKDMRISLHPLSITLKVYKYTTQCKWTRGCLCEDYYYREEYFYNQMLDVIYQGQHARYKWLITTASKKLYNKKVMVTTNTCITIGVAIWRANGMIVNGTIFHKKEMEITWRLNIRLLKITGHREKCDQRSRCYLVRISDIEQSKQ